MYKMIMVCFLSLFFNSCTLTIKDEKNEEQKMKKTILLKEIIVKIDLDLKSRNLIIKSNSGKIYLCFYDDFNTSVPGIGDTIYTIRLKDTYHRIEKIKLLFNKSDGCSYRYESNLFF